jgi:CubicO group peptidase (beta-lactamase class C family)
MEEPPPCCALAIDGRIVFARGAEIVAPWWSFTKTIIAAAAYVLAADARLDLDAPIAGGDYSIDELLRHRAGMPDYGGLATYQAAVRADEQPWSQDEFRAAVASSRGPKRGAFGYSNIGYMIATQQIEAACGIRLAAALQALVLAPLGINGAFVTERVGSFMDMRAGAASAYNPGWVAHGLMVGPPTAAALVLDRLARREFPTPALWARMRAGGIVGGPWPDRPWREAFYGAGLMSDRAGPLGRQFGHTGAGPDSRAAVYHFPDLAPARTAAVFMAGEDDGAVERAAIALADAPLTSLQGLEA